ncbi:MAG: Flp pilus assembly complex ATPase component TadA [Thaumarchaeota archaeon]|jgi:flagellar protein FlaI|nr:Flp pilus assembly complex ATPase component TadA [Candidatus Geocrenenecus arthurdayi]
MPLFKKEKKKEEELKINKGIRVDPIPQDYEVLQSYYVREGFAEVVIAAKPGIVAEPVYFVREVELNAQEAKALERLKDFLAKELEPPAIGEEQEVKKILLDSADKLLKKYGRGIGVFDENSKKKLFYYLERDLLGFGILNVIMEDYRIEDISCDGVNVPIYVWHRDYESLPTNIVFTDRSVLDDFIIQLAHKAGKHISSAFPMLDAMIYGKHRLAATFREEVSPRGSTFTIRKFREKPFSIIELIQSNVLSPELAAYFWLLLENKANIMVAGPTGSGKTTLLNALSCFIKPRMKIITCEETAELNMPTENWVRFVTRESYGLGSTKTGEITLYDLVRMSLRYRPDYLIVGEIRGEEAFVLFQAIASVSWNTPILVRDRLTMKTQLTEIGRFVDKFYGIDEERILKKVDNYDVLTLNDEGRICWRPIQYVLRHKTDKIYKIKYVGGAVEATGSHSVFVLDEENLTIKVKRVSELKKGDLLISYIARQENYNENPRIDLIDLVGDPSKDFVDGLPEELKSRIGCNPTSLSTYLLNEKSIQDRQNLRLRRWHNDKWIPAILEVDEDLAFAMGLYLAKGNVENHSGKSLCFILRPSEKPLLRRLIRVMEQKFNLKPYKEDRGSYLLITYNSTILAELFEKLIGGKTEDRRIPHFLWNSPTGIVEAFLEGYKAGSRRKARSRKCIRYTTRNRNIAQQISWLARINGLNTYLYEEKDKRDWPRFSVCISKARNGRRSPVADKIPLKPLIRLYKSLDPPNIPWNITYLLKKGRRFISRKVAQQFINWLLRKKGEPSIGDLELLKRINNLINSDIALSPVLEVREEDYEGYVYDVSVPKLEAFFGGDSPILLHNTGHGGLSTVHAESIETTVRRLTSPPMNIPPSHIPLLDVLCLVERTLLPKPFKGATFGRRIRNVWEIADYEKYITVAEWNPTTDTFTVDFDKSIILDQIALRWGKKKIDMIRELLRRIALLRWMVEKDVREISEVARIIYSYYTDPDKLIRELGIRVEEIYIPVATIKPREIPVEKVELAIRYVLELLRSNNGTVPYYQVFVKIPLPKDIIVEALKQLKEEGAIYIESVNVKLREAAKSI